jgi:hypothetical protein
LDKNRARSLISSLDTVEENTMLTATEVEKVAVAIVKLSLDPVIHFSVVAAIASALGNETTPTREKASPKRRRRRTTGNGATPPKPKRARGRPRAAHKPAKDTTQHRTGLHFLRGALSRGPKPMNHVEELARQKGISNDELQAAKSLLGIRAVRLDDRGVCYLLPAYQAEAAQSAG